MSAAELTIMARSIAAHSETLSGRTSSMISSWIDASGKQHWLLYMSEHVRECVWRCAFVCVHVCAGVSVYVRVCVRVDVCVGICMLLD
jgi:hypothetical protein